MFTTGIFAALLAASYALAAPSDTAAIVAYTLNGSGCPASSTGVTVNADNSISATFSSFNPSIDSPDPSTTRSNCQVGLQVQVPANQQFTLGKVQYDGYAELDASVTETHDVTYYFQGQIDQRTAEGSHSGPIDSNVDYSTNFSGTPIWSACGGQSIVNVNIQLALKTSKAGKGFATVDDTKIPLKFRRCI